MPQSYSPPGATAYPMHSGLPSNYTDIKIRGSEQSYITDNFGQTVIQSIATDRVSLSVESTTWHHLQEVWRQADYGPGLYVHLLKSESVLKHIIIKGGGQVELKRHQYISFVGDSVTCAYKPKETGTYTSILLWWSEKFLAELKYVYPMLRHALRLIVPGYAERVTGPTLRITSEMEALIEEILNQDYTGDELKRSFRNNMKKLVRMGLSQFKTLTKEQNEFEAPTRKKIEAAIWKIKLSRFREITLEQLSNEVGLGETRLKEGIKAYTGMGIKEYQKSLMFIKVIRLIVLKGKRIKDIFEATGYKTPDSLGKAFKKKYWCNITELKSLKWNTRAKENYVMSKEDRLKYGAMIARYMSGKLEEGEFEEINRWLLLHDEHLWVFEKLMDDKNS
ncbi:MAG: helix-turn-helix transcriptional regulator, partial [Chitinophagaceae bacterium]|nr:helix-turn-helix transcriptional regulator [Chitinophagaceae bacterium]